MDDAKACQLAVWWPVPIHDRLKRLVLRANRAGARTAQKELLAAIILAIEPSGEDLEEWVRRYRKATVQDALLVEADAPGGDNLIHFRLASRGRPSKGG